MCLVSIPQIPTNLFLFSQLFKLWVDLKLEGSVISSLITKPFAAGLFDSLSLLFVPILPIWGNVKVIIWLSYDGSVNISWYPDIEVLKQSSPIISPSKPIPFPKKKVLFAKANTAVGFDDANNNLGGVITSLIYTVNQSIYNIKIFKRFFKKKLIFRYRQFICQVTISF